jgi:hypothetical protein
MWCVWTIAVLVLLAALAIGFLWLARKSFRGQVCREFVDFLGEARADLKVLGHTEDVLVLEDGDGEVGQMYLGKLYQAIAELQQDTPETRREVFAHFLRSLTELEVDAKELNLADHGNRIMPRLVPSDFLSRLPPDSEMPHTPLANLGLEIVYVLNAPNSVMYLTGAHAKDLGLDTAGLHERALANLSATFPAELVRDVIESDKLPMFKALDSFDAARLLLVPRHLRDGETIVALIPDRDTLFLAPLPGNNDWSGLKQLARTPGSDHLILDRPVKVTNQGFELV